MRRVISFVIIISIFLAFSGSCKSARYRLAEKMIQEINQDISEAQQLINGANASMTETGSIYDEHIQKILAEFDSAYKNDTARIGRLYKNAKTANAISDSLYYYLQQLKDMMAEKAGGWMDSSKTAIENDQDLEIAENYFVRQKGGTNGEELRKMLETFEFKMRGLLIDKDGRPTPNAVKFYIDTKKERRDRDGVLKQWHEYYFEGVPVIAAITEITKFQNDVRNAQSEVTYYLYNQIK